MNKDFWKNKKVLITGHTGFKGSWLSLWLWSAGAEVYGYALEPSTIPSLFNLLKLSEKINHHEGDVRDLAVFKQYMSSVEPDVVIHMAAQALVQASYIDPVETFSTNVMGTVHLFEAVRVTPSVKVIINVTTDKCYENKEWPWGYRENDTLGGYDPYSNSKACSELITAAYRSSYFNPNMFNEHGKAMATARAGNVIGGGDWTKGRLIPDIINGFVHEEVINIRNPSAIRPWQHVLEPLSGYLLLAEKLWEKPEIYTGAWNFGPYDSDAVTVREVVKYLAEQWHGAQWKIDDKVSLHETKCLQLDISKATTVLGWKPRWALTRTLDSIVAWQQAFISQDEDILDVTLSQLKDYEIRMK